MMNNLNDPMPNLKDAAMRNQEVKKAVREARWRLNGRRCAVCLRQPDKIVMDHDHGSGLMRNVLCNPCNGALGHLERGDRAKAAWAYRHNRGQLSIDEWFFAADRYQLRWKSRTAALKLVIERHGEINAVRPTGGVPSALHVDVLDALVQIANSEQQDAGEAEVGRVRGSMGTDFQNAWTTEWQNIQLHAAKNGLTWRIAFAGLNFILAAMDHYPEVRRVMPTEADEMDVSYTPPELREKVRSTALIALHWPT